MIPELGHFALIVSLTALSVWLLLRINGHYTRVSDQIVLDPTLDKMPSYPEPILVVPVPGLNRVVARTIGYARALSENVTALHVTDDLEAADEGEDEEDHEQRELDRAIDGCQGRLDHEEGCSNHARVGFGRVLLPPERRR